MNYHKNGLEFNIIANYCSPLQIFQCTDGFNHSPFLALPTLLARQRGEPGKIIIVFIVIIIYLFLFWGCNSAGSLQDENSTEQTPFSIPESYPRSSVAANAMKCGSFFRLILYCICMRG